jgi:hypothetical protein
MSFLNMSIHDRGGGMGNRYKEWTRKCGEQILGVNQKVWGTDIRSGPINQAFTVSVIRIDYRTFWGQELSPNQNLFSHRKKISLSFFIYEKYVIYFQIVSPPPPENVTVVLFFFSSFRLIYVFLLNSLNIARSTTLEESTL